MSYGLRVYRPDGDLSITSDTLNYVFEGKYTAPTTVTSLTAPIVFVKSDTDLIAPIAPIVTNNNDGTWGVTFGFWQYYILPENVTSTASTASITAYVFISEIPASTGYGLKVVDGSGRGVALGTSRKPLIIKQRIFLDVNTAPKAITPYPTAKHGRTVPLPTPLGDYAGTVGGGAFQVAPPFTTFRDLFGDVQWLGVKVGSTTYILAGIPAHFYIPPTNDLITTHGGQHEGEELLDNTQMPDFYPVWLIDTYWYDQ